MSLAHLAGALQIRGLRPEHKMLLVVLCDNTDEEGTVQSSRQHVQRQASMSNELFEKSCTELFRVDLISWKLQPDLSWGITVELDQIRRMRDPELDYWIESDPENPFNNPERNPQ